MDNDKTKLDSVIRIIRIEMDMFKEHLRNTGGCDMYTTTAQAFRQAYDAGLMCVRDFSLSRSK